MRANNTLPMLLAGLLLLGPNTHTQAQKEGFPTTPPPDLPVRAVTLPQMETRTLANGLQVIVAESHRVPLVTMRLAVRAGSVLDPADQPGLAAAVANQITAGTDHYNSLQLREAAEKLGGAIGAAADDDYTTLSASGLAENVAPLADLLADVLLHPIFPASELIVYKRLTQQGLVVQQQNPDFLASRTIARALYGSHPYGTVATTPQAVQTLTPDAIQAFYKARYSPNNAVLVVVGDIQPAAVFAAAEKAFGGWAGGAPATAEYPAPPTRDARHIYLVDRPGSVQSNIVYGNLAIKRGDPDTFALFVANAILGGRSGSRLYNSVRERLGYAYSVSSVVTPKGAAGELTARAQTRTDVTAAALKEMLAQEAALQTQPVSAQDLQSTKSYLNGAFAISLASQDSLAARLLTNAVYHLPADYLSGFRDKINAVTAEDVQRVAQKYMQPDKSAIVVVGDANKLRDDLKSFGDVEDAK